MAYRTQKAQGISILSHRFGPEMDSATHRLSCLNLETQPYMVIAPSDFVVSENGAVEHHPDFLLEIGMKFTQKTKSWGLPLFARPCPTTPRHGFVDSRPVSTLAELMEVINETVKADPNGEIVVMPIVRADLSAVITAHSIGIGPGNDGATAGVGAVSYQIQTTAPTAEQKREARIADGDDAYFEVVMEGENGRLVQMRGGPQLGSASGDYIPHDVFVENVMKAEGDALVWEAKMAALKGNTGGTVVWHPGGWRGSHYAVHAINAGVPVIFSGVKPQMYDTFAATNETTAPPYDTEAIVAGIARGLAADLSQYGRDITRSSNLLTFAAVCTHGATSMRTGASAEMMGAGLAVLYRLAAAACVGEYRHKKSSNLSSDRNRVYIDTLERFDTNGRKRFARALTSFANEKWNASFGGLAWARCAMMTADLETALVSLIQSSSNRPDVETVVGRAHRLLNAAHNTGTLLNKFGSPDILDMAAAGNRWLALAAVTLWHRNSIAASTSRIITTMREVFGIDEIAAQARKFWNTERGEFLDLNEAIERALTTKTGKRRKLAGAIEIGDAPEFLAHFGKYDDYTLTVQFARSNETDRIIKRPARLKLPKNVYGTGEPGAQSPVGRKYIKRIASVSEPAAVLCAHSALGWRTSFAGSAKRYHVAEVVANESTVTVIAVTKSVSGVETRRSILTLTRAEIAEQLG